MVFTALVHLIPNLGGRQTIVALYIRCVHSFALQLLLLQKMIKRYMGNIRDKLFVQAVYTFSMGTVLALPRIVHFFVLKVDFGAVKAPASWTMIAFRLILVLFFI